MKINVEYTEGAFDFSNLLDEDLFQISRKVVNVPAEAVEEMEKRGLIAEGFSKSVDAIFYQVEMENMEINGISDSATILAGSLPNKNIGKYNNNIVVANISSKGLNSDIHASAEYRAHIIKVMAKKALSSC